jgi:hypothetical protein
MKKFVIIAAAPALICAALPAWPAPAEDYIKRWKSIVKASGASSN